MTRKMNDTLALFLTALIGLAIPIILTIFIPKKEWAMFVFMSLAYIAMLVFGFHKTGVFRRSAKKKIFLFIALYWTLTTGIAVLVFGIALLPLPQKPIPYAVSLLVLSLFALNIFQYLETKVNFLKKQ